MGRVSVRVYCFFLLAVCLASLFLPRAEIASARNPAARTDGTDVANTNDAEEDPAPPLQILLLTEDGPICLAVTTNAGEVPLHSAWRQWARTLFAHLDRDGSNDLSQSELALAPAPKVIRRWISGVFYTLGTTDLDETAAAIFAPDGEQTISFAKFIAAYEAHGLGSPLVTWAEARRATDLDQALLNEFQRISNEASAQSAAAELIRRLDLNGDEMVAAHELVAKVAFPYALGTQVVTPSAPADTASVVRVFSAAERDMAAALLATLDQNQDHKLQAAEMLVQRAIIHTWDQNGDGVLEGNEITAWNAALPRLHVAASLPAEGAPPPAECNSSNEHATAAWNIARRWGGTLVTGRADRIDIRAGKGRIDLALNSGQAMLALMAQRFREADVNSDLALDAGEVSGFRNGFFQIVFPQIDFNADGKLTDDEIQQYFSIAVNACRLNIQVNVVRHAHHLFAWLDTDRDGKLSALELTADADFQGLRSTPPAASPELPHQWRITISHGQPLLPGMPGFEAARGETLALSDAPQWFLQMDRNRDCTISAREFVGNREAFARLDANDDGLLTVREAKNETSQGR